MSLIKVERFGKKLELDDKLIGQINLLFIPRIENFWDNIIPITGMEGTGKSTLAQEIAWYISGPNSRIVFTFEQFSEAFNNLSAGGTIIWDEFVFAGMAGDANSKLSRLAKKIFVTGRKKRLNILLLMPSIHMMEKYFAMSRTICLIHCDSPDLIKRGFGYFYSKKRKNSIRGNKLFRDSLETPIKWSNFSFKFSSPIEEIFDEKEYQRLKDEAISTLFAPDDEEKTDKRQDKFKFRFLKEHADDILSMSEKESSEIFGVDIRTVASWKRFIKDKILKNE